MQHTGRNTHGAANPVLGPSHLAIAGFVRAATLEPAGPVMSRRPGLLRRTFRGLGRLFARRDVQPGGVGQAIAGFVRTATLGR